MRCLVTGGSKGLGLACAEEMLKLGAMVVLTARGAADLNKVQAVLNVEHPGRIFSVVADLSGPSGRETAVAKLVELWGPDARLDVLVNNVGTNKRKRVDEVDANEYHMMVATNQDSAFFMCKLCFPMLCRSSHASIVNVSSLAGLRSTGTGVPYAMTKAAMTHMTKALACEWARHRIRVNCVAPWMARTPLLEEATRNDPTATQAAQEATPLNRLGEPNDTSGAVAFLCMPAAAYVTGQVIAVDGGIAAQGFCGPCSRKTESSVG